MPANTLTIDPSAGAARPLRLRIWAPQSFVYLLAGLHSVFADSFPDSLQTAIAGIVGLFVIVAAALPWLRRGKLTFDAAQVGLVVTLLSLSFAHAFLNIAQNDDFFVALMRSVTGVAAIVYFARLAAPVVPAVKIIVALAAILAAMVLTARHGLYDYAGILRPQPFAGEDAIHSSGYVVIAAFLAVVLMRLRGEIGRPLALMLGLPLFLLLVAYQVRTTWVMLIVFFATLAVFSLYRSLDRRLFSAMLGTGVAAIVLLVPLLLMFVLPALDLDTFSSGRTATYLERFDMLAGRTPAEFLFGTGLGTDSFYSSSWWWEPKDSHNDFLHVLIEQGFVCLAALAAIFLAALRRADMYQAAVLLSFVSGSAISNALLDRPMLAVLYLGLLAFAAPPRNGFPATASAGRP